MISFGDLCQFLATSNTYEDWTMARLKRQFIKPMSLKQAMAFQRDGRMVGFATWAFVGDDILLELLRGERAVAPSEWKSGENIFFADFIAPYGDTPWMAMQLRAKFGDELGKGVRAHYYRRERGRAGHVRAKVS